MGRGNAINAVDAFFRGFNNSYDSIGRVLRDMDLNKVQTAQPGLTQQALTQTEPEKAVTLPGVDGAPAEKLTVGGDLKLARTADFLGEKVNPDDKDAVEKVRRTKMADVLGKYDPAEGARMRRDIKVDERADWAFDREQKRAKREDDATAKDEAYIQGRNAMFANTRFGRGLAAHAEQLQAWKAAGGQGEPPRRPAYTALDAIGDQADLLDFDAQHGKLDAKAFGDFTQKLRTMQDEGYEKALRMAHAGAALPQVLQLFNAAGNERVAPDDVAKDERAAGPDGVQTRRITLKDGTVIDTLASLDSLGKAGEVFSRHFKAQDDKRDDRRLGLQGDRVGLAQRADRRAQAEFNAGGPARRVSQLLGEAQASLLDPKATPVQRQGASARLADYAASRSTAAGGSVPAEIQLARFALASKVPGVTTEGEALEWVRRSKEKSPQALRAELYKAALQSGGDGASARAEVDEAMRYLYPGAGGTAAPPSGAVEALRKNPALRAQFDAKYGAGAAARALQQ